MLSDSIACNRFLGFIATLPLLGKHCSRGNQLTCLTLAMALSFAEFLAQEMSSEIRRKIAKPYQCKNGPKHFTPERTMKLCKVVNYS